jgi:hypothetical protein
MNTIKQGKKILTLSRGNKKLVANGNNVFLIWNLTAESTCPNSTKLCRKFCYAKKAERLYPSVRKSRTEQMEESTKSDFVENMINTINWQLGCRSIKGKKIYFRIHESGDFYSQKYFNNWVAISKVFPDIKFMAYTKSVKYIKNTEMSIPSNFVLRYSIWDDTKKDQLEMASSLELPIYTAFPKDELKEMVKNGGFTKCDCDCTKCKKCYSNHYQKLAVAIH